MPTELVIGGRTVAPGERTRIEIPIARLVTGADLELTLEVLRGPEAGPSIWLSGAVHGDEPIGVEIIRQVLDRLDPADLRGTVIAVPIVNVIGFLSESRYLPDRRDLNRSFPGSKQGSLAARLANIFMREVVRQCQFGIDIHCGSGGRSNFPNVRCNLSDPETRAMAEAFGAPLMVNSRPPKGSLRRAALSADARVLLFEGGEAKRFDDLAVRAGVDGILRTLAAVAIWHGSPPAATDPTRESHETYWLRARLGGILRPTIELGQIVERGQSIGIITDVSGETRTTVKARAGGMVFGLRLSPLVYRGDAVAHVAKLVEP